MIVQRYNKKQTSVKVMLKEYENNSQQQNEVIIKGLQHTELHHQMR